MVPSPEQNLFGEYVEAWRNEWNGMPEYVQENKKAWETIDVAIPDEAALQHFRQKFETRSGATRKTYWYPYQPRKSLGFVVGGPTTTRYPIYVISKSRWESRLTSKALERSNIPYRIVVEPQELEQYASVISREKILVLPFSNLGQGSIPARNWVWEHAISEGHKWHWILDDNIRTFMRLNRNLKLHTRSAAMFCAAEDFVDRYSNLGQAGFHYQWFAPHREKLPAYYPNTRVYSCILIRNDLPYRWRGRYNEDTDLSLRILKDGLCTILFNAFLCDKIATMTMTGGNSDELYIDDGRLKMAQSLVEQHPDVATVSRKWGRWQHHVDYRPFQGNTLERRDDVPVPEGINEYGMVIQEHDSVPEIETPEQKRARELEEAKELWQLMKEEAWAEEWNQACKARHKDTQTTMADFSRSNRSW